MEPTQFVRCGAWACLLLCTTSSIALTRDFQVDQVRRGVVYIKSFIPNVGTGVGTGFIVGEDGLIVTNRHVIESGHRSHRDSVIVVGVPAMDDPEQLDYFRAQVVHVVEAPESRDFAVLKIAAQPDYGSFRPLQLSKRKLELGEHVSVLGFPFIQEGEPTISLTEGIISSTRVQFDSVSFYQTDAALNPGNSGGPLLEASGAVAGIVTLKISGADNIGYSIHLSEVEKAFAEAKAKAAAIHPDPGPIPADQMPDLDQLAAEDSEAGSGTEARRPDWAEAKPFEAISRIWTSADGRFKAEATYITSKDDEVTLRRPAGTIINVPRARLSELDRYYVRAMESPWKDEGRLPAPPESVIELKSKQIHEIFGSEFEQGGEQLFSKLLTLAIETRSQDPAAAYVCLCEASRVAARGAQFELCFGTLAGLEKWYEVEGRLLPLQTEVLGLAASAAREHSDHVQVFTFALRLITFAEERRDFESGATLVELAKSAVQRLRSGDLLSIIRRRSRRFEDFQAAYRLSEAARARLLKEPKNRPAHFAIGRFMAVFEKQWNAESLRHLADGSDPDFAAAAQLELAGPTTPTSQLVVADSWWALGEDEEDEFSQYGLFSHAIEWYGRCLPKLSALDRTKAEQRLAKFAAEFGDTRPGATSDDRIVGSGRRYALRSRAPWPPYLDSARATVTQEGLSDVGDNFIHTRERDFSSEDFRFEVLLTLKRDAGIAFVGIGDLFSGERRGEPSNALRFRIHSTGFHNGEVQIARPNANGDIIGRLPKECTIRALISKRGHSVTMTLDVDDDGPTPDDLERTIPDIRDAAPNLNSKNAYLFFGGSGTFSEVCLTRGPSIAPPAREAEPEAPQMADLPRTVGGRLTRIASASRDFDFSDALISRQGLQVRPKAVVRSERPDFLDRDFRFQLVLTVPESTQREPLHRSVWIGIGEGGEGRGNEPGNSVCFKLACLEQLLGDGQVTLSRANEEGMLDRGSVKLLGKLNKPGTHRVTIEKTGVSVRFVLDVDNDGESPDDLEITVPDIAEYAPFLHRKNSHIYFGGNAYFTHVGLEIQR